MSGGLGASGGGDGGHAGFVFFLSAGSKFDVIGEGGRATSQGVVELPIELVRIR